MSTLLLGLIRIKKNYCRIDKFSQAYIATYHSVFLIIAQPYSYIFIIFSVQRAERAALAITRQFPSCTEPLSVPGERGSFGLHYLYSLL